MQCHDAYSADVKGKVAVHAYEDALKHNSADQWKGRENDAGTVFVW